MLLVAMVAAVLPASGRVLVTPDQAVKEAFPGADAAKRTDYLTGEQARRIESLAGSPPSSKIVVSWRGLKDGRLLGTAYLEAHLVRTLPETILVLVGPDGKVGKVEILSFDEPDDYRPRPRWLDQFHGRALDPDLSLQGSVRGITGATLSSRAIASAVRRVLATHAVLAPSPVPPTAPPIQQTAPPVPPTAPPATQTAPPAAPPPAVSDRPPARPPSPQGPRDRAAVVREGWTGNSGLAVSEPRRNVQYASLRDMASR